MTTKPQTTETPALVTRRHRLRSADLPARLTRARGERTQGEAAQLCGVSKQGWNVWEGGRSALTTEHVCKIARALGVDAAWLAFGDDPEPVPLTGEPLTWEGYGARVREARDKKGLSLDAAATALGFANRGGPHKIETERVRLDLALCERLAQLLGKTPEYLAFGRR